MKIDIEKNTIFYSRARKRNAKQAEVEGMDTFK